MLLIYNMSIQKSIFFSKFTGYACAFFYIKKILNLFCFSRICLLSCDNYIIFSFEICIPNKKFGKIDEHDFALCKYYNF